MNQLGLQYCPLRKGVVAMTTPSARMALPLYNLRPVHKCKLSVAAGEAIHRNWSKGILSNGIKISR